MTGKSWVVYWAGGLFDHKELLGNLHLASALEAVTMGRCQVVLPQNEECETGRDAVSIRNSDLAQLISCDAMVANFDGTELDSGTVVEFCIAKALDMPAVLLRTDFRASGDSKDVPWNLMCAGWPRTEILWINAMAEYRQCREHCQGAEEIASLFHRNVARKIATALETVCTRLPWLSGAEAPGHYRRVVQSAGNGLERMFPEETIASLIREKTKKGLFASVE